MAGSEVEVPKKKHRSHVARSQSTPEDERHELEEVTGMPMESLEPELSKLEFGGAPLA